MYALIKVKVQIFFLIKLLSIENQKVLGVSILGEWHLALNTFNVLVAFNLALPFSHWKPNCLLV